MASGKAVVLGLVGLVTATMVAAFLWPEGKEEDAAERAASAAAPEEGGGGGGGLRVTRRSADGTVEISNRAEDGDDRIAASRRRRAAEASAREAAGEPSEAASGFAAFVDDGRPLTTAAMERPRMDGMVGTEPDYDAVVEAQQRFAPFEADLLAEVPLDPDKWRRITRAHQESIKGVFKRSQQLTAAGNAAGARALIEEWGELQGKYQAQAYGRAPQPVSGAAGR